MTDFDKNKAAIGELVEKTVVESVNKLKAELQEEFKTFVTDNSPVDHENLDALKKAVTEADKNADELVKKKIKKRKDKHLRKDLSKPVTPQKVAKDKDEAKKTIAESKNNEHFMFKL